MGHMYYVLPSILSYRRTYWDNSMIKTSRRKFLGIAGAAAGAALITRNLPAWAVDKSITLAVVPPLSVFNYSQIKLLDGPMREQFDHTHELFLNLDESHMLHTFRQLLVLPGPCLSVV